MEAFYAIDWTDTTVHDDAVSFTTNSQKTELKIAVVVPKIRPLVFEDELVDRHIRNLLQRGRVHNEERSNVDTVNLFSRQEAVQSSLNETDPKEAIVLNLSIEQLYARRGQKFEFVEEMQTDKITIRKTTYEQFNEASDLDDIIIFLDAILKEKPRLHTKAHIHNRKTFDRHGISNWLVHIMCDLFNDACMRACEKHDIPYFGLYFNKNSITISNGSAVFNKPLRSVLAFMNIINLHACLTGKRFPLNEIDVVNALKSSGFNVLDS